MDAAVVEKETRRLPHVLSGNATSSHVLSESLRRLLLTAPHWGGALLQRGLVCTSCHEYLCFFFQAEQMSAVSLRLSIINPTPSSICFYRLWYVQCHLRVLMVGQLHHHQQQQPTQVTHHHCVPQVINYHHSAGHQLPRRVGGRVLVAGPAVGDEGRVRHHAAGLAGQRGGPARGAGGRRRRPGPDPRQGRPGPAPARPAQEWEWGRERGRSIYSMINVLFYMIYVHKNQIIIVKYMFMYV